MGAEPGELNDPPPKPNPREDAGGSRRAIDFGAKSAEPGTLCSEEPEGGAVVGEEGGEEAHARGSSRRRSKPVKYEDAPSGVKTVEDGSGVDSSGVKLESSDDGKSRAPPAKWGWYPPSALPALCEWLRESKDPGEAALAEAILKPPEAEKISEKEKEPADTSKEGDEKGEKGQGLVAEKEKDKGAQGPPPVSQQLLRGGGTSTDGYVGLDRPLMRGVDASGPRALVALRVALARACTRLPFWEGDARTVASNSTRLASVLGAARKARDVGAAKVAALNAEALLNDAGHLDEPTWKARRHAWRAALRDAATLPQVALRVAEMADARPKDKRREKMSRDAFLRIWREMERSKDSEKMAPPFMPQVGERVVLVKSALVAAYLEAAKHAAKSGDRKGKPPADASAPFAAFGLAPPATLGELAATTTCRVEFAGYRKGDPASAAPAERLPQAWYLLAPIADAPAFAAKAEADADDEKRADERGDERPHAAEVRESEEDHAPREEREKEKEKAAVAVVRHVFPGLAPDFLVPAEHAEASLRKPWAPGDRVRRTFEKVSGATKSKETVNGVVVKTNWWRERPEDLEEALAALDDPKPNASRTSRLSRADAREAVLVRWDDGGGEGKSGGFFSGKHAGSPAGSSDGGAECVGCHWVSPWDVDADVFAEEARRRAREEAAERRRALDAARAALLSSQSAAKSTHVTDKDDARGDDPNKFAFRTRGARAPVDVPPRESFDEALEWFHEHHPLGPGKPLKVPQFCKETLDLHKVMVEVQLRGGFRAVTEAKRWKDVCRALGRDLSGQTSASFAMRQNYERCLVDFEAHLELEAEKAEKAEDDAPAEKKRDAPEKGEEASDDEGATTRAKRRRS